MLLILPFLTLQLAGNLANGVHLLAKLLQLLLQLACLLLVHYLFHLLGKNGPQ
ncbi:MAG TPA: hypothetical protein GX735_07150 [Firmicutes bacterium]|nr:hypothetical protein [Bacillota bacterium]